MSADYGSTFTLFIEKGLHAGTVQRLEPGIYTLGSELESDIILSDQQVEAVHLIIELDRRGLRLEPLQGAIAIKGESTSLEPGGERHLALPASFTVGEAVIKITAPQDAVQSRRRMRVAMAGAGLALLAVVGFQIMDPLANNEGGGPTAGDAAIGALMQPPSPAFADGPSNDMSVGGHADRGEVDSATASGRGDVAMAMPGLTLDQAAAALRERLAADDLTDIEVKIADDRLMVRGEALPDRMDDWQTVRIWFDGTFGRDFLLVANVEPAEKETPPMLAIEAVWSGEDPYLVAGGQRFFVGAHIGDGWTIARIGSDEITFKLGDRSFSLTL